VITQADLFGTGWRAIFLVNVPIGILALIGAVWSMPSRPGWIRHKLDSRGLVLLTGALFALFYPLVQGRELGWPLWSIILMVASVPLFGAFFWQQAAQSRSGGEPLIPPSLLRYKTLLTALAILFTLTAALGVFFVINMHLQLGLGFSPLQTVLVFLPSAVGSIIGNFGAVKLAAKIGRAFIATAVAGVLVSMVSMAILVVVLGNSLGPWSLSVSTLVFGLGIGAMMNSLFTLAMGDIEPQDAGAVSGVVGTTLQLGSASGIALFGTIFFAGFASGGTVSATVTSLVVSIVVLLVTLAVSARLPRSRAAREAVAAAG
jgi:predicted MFS family arabinose efflux permease